MSANYSKLRLLLLPDQRAAKMAALMMRETAAPMISWFFNMAHEKGEMIAHGGENVKLLGSGMPQAT